MKSIGIVGSPRKNGNTEIITRHILKAISEEGIEAELIRLAGRDIRPCDACTACRSGKICPIQDDLLPIYTQMKEADAIILTSPVYYGSATALLKALMERTGHISRGDGEVFQGKIGGSFVVSRRSSHYFTQSQINFWFHVLGFFMPGSTHPNIAFGREKGDVENDKEGLSTAWNFGKNTALLVKKLRAQ
ncbi:flavodoxin family protein [Chloroflexota bacterium]